MQISEEILEKIKQQNDIVDVISETVKLKRSGRNFSGLCPFHNEKSPSFSVSGEKQIYKCFGCGEAGNVISFVMKTRNMQFLDAVKHLADRAGIILENSESKNPIAIKKDKMFNVNVEAARFYFANLTREKKAMDYFVNRGITIETIRKFGLGYAKDDWNNLMFYLRKKGYSDELLYEAGLLSKSSKSDRCFDKFRNRVIFPVFDYRGKVIGFGGRVLDDSKPKYLNSPETLVFQKGTNLYGLNFALKQTMKERYFIIVEGYMDVIALNQSGITNVVASLGTALTESQAMLLKRYADKVIIAYDADVAGQNATLRGLEVLRSVIHDVRVLSIPSGKDPDEFIRSNGKEAFIRLIDGAAPLIDYRLKKAEDGIDFKNSQSVIKYGDRVTEILANVNPVEKDVYIKKISENTGIKEQALYDVLSKEMTKIQNNNENMNNKEENGTKLYVEPAFLKAERSLLKLALEDEYSEFIIEGLNEENFILLEHMRIFSIIKEGKKGKINNIETYVEARCEDVKVLEEFIKIKDHELLASNDMKVLIRDFIEKLKTYKLKQKLEKLRQEQKKLESQGKIEESIGLAVEITKVTRALKGGERQKWS
ncbi:MAG: DNA primase [Clostridium sp.]